MAGTAQSWSGLQLSTLVSEVMPDP
jgi:hypothetical protein